MQSEKQTESLDFDMLVIGAGMAGMSAGGRAAEAGARVLVVEKAEEIGGSAKEASFIWTVPDPRVLRGWDDGDPRLAKVIFQHFAEAVEWMHKREVVQFGPTPVLHGRGYQIDIPKHQRLCEKAIQSSGGYVTRGAQVKEPILDADGRVQGACFMVEDELIEVRAPWTVLATGGYQADPELRAQRIHLNARNIPLRSNPYSTGDGIRFGFQAGGAWAGENPGFYGHLVSSPPDISWENPALFANLAQYHSDFSLLFNEAGHRFTDESQGDFRSSNMLVFETNARGLLVWDEHVQREHVMKSFVYGVDPINKLELAIEHGAHGAKVSTVDGIEEAAASWGFEGKTVVRTLVDYNQAVQECPEKLKPPRAYDLRPMDEAPYYVLVVEPAITFTHAGLWVDDYARVLNHQGEPIPGLLAAGADAGNVFKLGYAGGIALATTFALRAAKTAGWN